MTEDKAVETEVTKAEARVTVREIEEMERDQEEDLIEVAKGKLEWSYEG